MVGGKGPNSFFCIRIPNFPSSIFKRGVGFWVWLLFCKYRRDLDHTFMLRRKKSYGEQDVKNASWLIKSFRTENTVMEWATNKNTSSTKMEERWAERKARSRKGVINFLVGERHKVRQIPNFLVGKSHKVRQIPTWWPFIYSRRLDCLNLSQRFK